jgi:phage replication O-like protein O
MARALIPNSTQVPDVILDHWMAELSGAEFKVLMYVARRTYGFGKDSDRISLNQIARGIRRRDGRCLDRGTGLSRTGVKAACYALIDRGLLIRQANRTEEGQECAESTYRLNLYATPAGVGQKSAHLGRGDAHVGQDEAEGGAATNRGVGQKVTPQETESQETEQETAAAEGEPGRVTDADAAPFGLVEELVTHGVSRSVARELAAEKPAVCRRCLEYLPYATIRTTPGAWLASAIRDEFGPPPGYLKAVKCAQQPARLARREPERPRGVRIDELWASYRQLETTQPEAIAAFEAFVGAEKRRIERIAAGLSPRRRGEHLAAFGSEEYRLELFGRWLRRQGANAEQSSVRSGDAEPLANATRG